MAEMNKISWSALPQDLLMSIAERLETSVELMSFRAVCPSWRYVVPISLFGSKNILSPVFPYRGMNHSSIVVASSVYLVRSAVNPELPPWLITVEEFSPGKLYVRAPLSRVAIKNLPDGFQHTLDLSDFHLQELGRFYGLRRYDNPEEMFTERRLSRYDNKVVLFVDPDCTESPPTIDDCSVVELYDHVDYLTLTRLKNGEKHQVYSNFRREFDDIVNFKGKIYAVDYQGNVCFLDYHSLKMSSFIEEPLADVSRSNYKKRFAVTCEELYLIFRRSQKSDYHSAFKIFKLNEKKKKWDEIEGGIGDDKTIFVTFDGCFFASVKDFPGWKGNCIVFRRGSFPEYSGLGEFDSKIFQEWGIGIGVGIGFDWNINLDVAVFHFDSGYCVPIATYPRYSEVIWPPPAWLRKGERKVPYLSRRFPKNNLFKI